MNPASQMRVASIDILRALTMTLMIFVNDLWSLTNIPLWLEHKATDADGMGLADTVFPAFLFITGMSIPLAVKYRRSKGENNTRILSHIFLRSVALLTMGLFLVNGEYINETATGMNRVIWNSICCTCFILIWNEWSPKLNSYLISLIKWVAILALIFLAWIYRGGDATAITRFGTHWWGILGLIGWAYLVSAVIFTLSGNRIVVILVAWFCFIFLSMASHSGWTLPSGSLKTILSPFSGGSLAALVTGGVLVTMIFLHFQVGNKPRKMMIVLFLIGVVLLIAGFYTRSFWDISKNRATPPWVLICSAIPVFTFLIIYWIADLKSKAGWFTIIKPAGTNTLLCYLLPYYAYALVVLLHLSLPGILLDGYLGLLKSLLFSLLIVTITGLLGKAGMKLKI